MSWSFPMNLFVWSTVWWSLFILKMNWIPETVELNSWPSRLWSRNSSPPPSLNPHTRLWENQVNLPFEWLFVRHGCYSTVLYLLVRRWLIPHCPKGKKLNSETQGFPLRSFPATECRCDERLKTKSEESALLGYTGLIGELEHLKIETRLIDQTCFYFIMNQESET